MRGPCDGWVTVDDKPQPRTRGLRGQDTRVNKTRTIGHAIGHRMFIQTRTTRLHVGLSSPARSAAHRCPWCPHAFAIVYGALRAAAFSDAHPNEPAQWHAPSSHRLYAPFRCASSLPPIPQHISFVGLCICEGPSPSLPPLAEPYVRRRADAGQRSVFSHRSPLRAAHAFGTQHRKR